MGVKGQNYLITPVNIAICPSRNNHAFAQLSWHNQLFIFCACFLAGAF
jgi:hypothetical protein